MDIGEVSGCYFLPHLWKGGSGSGVAGCDAVALHIPVAVAIALRLYQPRAGFGHFTVTYQADAYFTDRVPPSCGGFEVYSDKIEGFHYSSVVGR